MLEDTVQGTRCNLFGSKISDKTINILLKEQLPVYVKLGCEIG